MQKPQCNSWDFSEVKMRILVPESGSRTVTLMKRPVIQDVGHANRERQVNRGGEEGVDRVRGALKGSQRRGQALPQGPEVARNFPQARGAPKEEPRQDGRRERS